MSDNWFYTTDDRQPREASTEEIRQLIASGVLEPAHWVWTSGLWRWVRAGEFERVHARLGEREAVPPPLPEPTGDERDLADGVLFRGKLMLGDLRKLFRRGRKLRLENLWSILILNYIPVIGSVINRGWRLDLMRTSNDDGFPRLRNIGSHISDGMFLWAMSLLYLFPLFFLLALNGFSWVDDALALIWWFIEVLFKDQTTRSFGEILATGSLRFTFESFIVFAYPLFSWPFYRTAMMRYALEDDKKVFFDFRRNYRTVRLEYRTLLEMFIPDKSLWIIWILLSMLFAVTGIGVFLIPAVLNPLRLAASAALYKRGTRDILPMTELFPK